MGFSSFAMGFDAFGSSATDVSAFWLISSFSFWHHAAFSQNVETSVAAERQLSGRSAFPLQIVICNGMSRISEWVLFLLKGVWLKLKVERRMLEGGMV